MLLPTLPIFTPPTPLPPTLGKPKLSLCGMRQPKPPVLQDRRLSAQPNFERPGDPRLLRGCSAPAAGHGHSSPACRAGASGARGPSENPH